MENRVIKILFVFLFMILFFTLMIQIENTTVKNSYNECSKDCMHYYDARY